MWIFDAYVRLSMNTMQWNGTESLGKMSWICAKAGRARLISQIALREQLLFPICDGGHIGICVATQIARHVKLKNSLKGWHSPEQAWAHSQAQLAWYKVMEEDGQLVQTTNS